jgi:hypothetical protein
VFGPIVFLLSKRPRPWFISTSNKTLTTVPFPARMIGRSLRPQIRVQHERSGVVTAGDQFRRPLGLSCWMADGPTPRSRDMALRTAQYSITPAHSNSSTDAEESLMRAPERRARRADALAGNHVVLFGRLAARAEGTRQITRQILRDAGGTRQ